MPPTQSTLFVDKGDLGLRPNWVSAMGIGYPPHDKQDRLGVLLGADNVLPLREKKLQGREPPRQGDEFLDVLSPLLEEAAGLQRDESPHREASDALALLEENARLRKLAVRLSNLLGDLPRRTWEALCSRAG